MRLISSSWAISIRCSSCFSLSGKVRGKVCIFMLNYSMWSDQGIHTLGYICMSLFIIFDFFFFIWYIFVFKVCSFREDPSGMLLNRHCWKQTTNWSLLTFFYNSSCLLLLIMIQAVGVKLKTRRPNMALWFIQSRRVCKKITLKLGVAGTTLPFLEFTADLV